MKSNSLYKKILALVLVFLMVCIPFNTISYAEDNDVSNENANGLLVAGDSIDKTETPVNECYDDGWEGFYKNFIVDIAEVKMSFYKGGSLVNTTYVLPLQFQGSSALKITKDMIDGAKDVVLRNPDGDYLSIGHCKFSDNIPMLTKYTERYQYCKFNEWSGAKEFKD